MLPARVVLGLSLSGVLLPSIAYADTTVPVAISLIGVTLFLCWLGITALWSNSINTRAIEIAHQIFDAKAAQVDEAIKQAYAEKEQSFQSKIATEKSKADAEYREAKHSLSIKAADLTKSESRIRALTAAFDTSYIDGRKWLADFIAEAFESTEIRLADYYRTKSHPAPGASERLKETARQTKELRAQLNLLRYTLKTYEEYFPALADYAEDIINEEASFSYLASADTDDDVDVVSRYLSDEDYKRLSPVARNQLALDTWRNRKKSNVEIGRMYERYLGYTYEIDGWKVAYTGALNGLEDMGRDLICTKGKEILVVQAKNWAKTRTIHEKHIFQLFGTTTCYRLKHPGCNVSAVFITTANLSETATQVAAELSVDVRYVPMSRDYPMIKCNSKSKDKIYHLPMDQQYDRLQINKNDGCRYVATTAEAEKLGYRRAWRHTGH